MSQDLPPASRARALRSRPAGGSPDTFWNVLTVLLIVGIFLLVGVFTVIFNYPFTSLNPFPPATPVSMININIPTETPVKVELPPTWTPTPRVEPSATQTRVPFTPTATVTVFSLPSTPTQTPVPPTGTVTPTELPVSAYPFQVFGKPAAVASSQFRADVGCSWMGVGGWVSDLQNAPVPQIIIQLGGTLASTPFDLPSMTGTALQYGQAGYEFTLTDRPIASKKSLWLQLLDQAGLALSPKVYFDTYDDCQKNLVLVNFKQVK
jgi:hypothetical protein